MGYPGVAPAAPQQIGAYQLGERLGGGPSTAVYRAYQPALHRWVALKLLPAPRDPTAFWPRFREIVEALARLEHPHILALHDYGQHAGVPYLVVPYVPGGTLEARLAAGAPRDWALAVLLQVCGAVAHAHRHRVAHGALAARNVLLRADTWPLVADFGVAALLAALGVEPRPDPLVPPERARGAPPDPRADIYALGVLLYWVLAGAPPLGVPGAGARPGAPPTLAARCTEPALVRVWDPVLARALAPNPWQRFPTVEALVAAVQAAWAAERPGPAPRRPAAPAGPEPMPARPGPARRPPRARPLGLSRGRRLPAWAIALGGALVLGGALASAHGGATERAIPVAALGEGAPPGAGAAVAPTADPAPVRRAAEPGVLLQDDFTDPRSGWPRHSADPASREVGYVDGEYRIAKIAGSEGAPFVGQSVEAGDFLGEIDARLVPPLANAYLYLDFRRQENGDHYALVVDPNDRTVRLERITQGVRRELLPWTKHLAIEPAAARNRLGVRAVGADIEVFVNGQRVGRVVDDTLGRGAIGFGVGNFRNGPAEGRFDNLVLRALAPAP